MFDCTWQEFKNSASELLSSSDSLNSEEMDNSIKMLNLLYLGMSEDMWRSSATILLHMVHKKCNVI